MIVAFTCCALTPESPTLSHKGRICAYGITFFNAPSEASRPSMVPILHILRSVQPLPLAGSCTMLDSTSRFLHLRSLEWRNLFVSHAWDGSFLGLVRSS